MLVLTRKIGENIRISDNVTVALLGIKGNQARIGIDAPEEIAVDRQEIYEKKQQEKQSKHKVEA